MEADFSCRFLKKSEICLVIKILFTCRHCDCPNKSETGYADKNVGALMREPLESAKYFIEQKTTHFE